MLPEKGEIIFEYTALSLELPLVLTWFNWDEGMGV